MSDQLFVVHTTTRDNAEYTKGEKRKQMAANLLIILLGLIGCAAGYYMLSELIYVR